MILNILWTAPPRRDLQAHLDYLAERNREAALALDEAMRAAIDRLSEYPFSGRPGRRNGTRELVIVGWPYVMVYSTNAARVLILRVPHTAQDCPPRWVTTQSMVGSANSGGR